MKTINSFILEKLKITKYTINDQYDYVDLGLPSGTLWAKCNIGANEEHEYGDYFAWGETKPKKCYWWDTYKYCDDNFGYNNGIFYGLTKYNDNGKLTKLEPSDDAAHVNMGNKWYIPTKEQFQELLDNTTNEWVENYNGTNVNGQLLTSKRNNNKIFFPVGGVIYNDKLNYDDEGFYWSSITTYSRSVAALLEISDDGLHINGNDRCGGRAIRPVLNK